jgi:hypothetical protein
MILHASIWPCSSALVGLGFIGLRELLVISNKLVGIASGDLLVVNPEARDLGLRATPPQYISLGGGNGAADIRVLERLAQEAALHDVLWRKLDLEDAAIAGAALTVQPDDRGTIMRIQPGIQKAKPEVE